MFYYFCKNYLLKKFFTIAAFLFLSSFIFAQKSDTAKVQVASPIAEYFVEKDFFPNNSSYKEIDTSLDKIQKYFPNNFPYSLGLATGKLLFEPSTETGFKSGLENLDLVGYNRSEIKYYRTRTPYTEIIAVFGQKKEQFAKLLHTQNITKRWNIAVNMFRLRASGTPPSDGGFYQRQNSSDNNVSLSSNFTSNSNRYSFLVNGAISSIKSDENGGIRNDTVFENNLFLNKKLIPVNLLGARTRRGNREFTVAQFLNFGRRDTSAKTDSTSKKIIPRSALSYSFHSKENWFVYEDKNPSSGFYENILTDSVLTLDSTYIFSFNNAIAWETYLMRNIFTKISFNQKNTRLVQYNADSALALDTNFYDQAAKLEIGNSWRRNKSKGFFWNIGKQYIVAGAHKGDDYIYGTLSYLFDTNKKLSLDYNDAHHSLPFVYNYYNSNHFYWKNSFDNTTERIIGASFHDLKHKLAASAANIYMDNYVYFDSTFFPTFSKWRDAISFYKISVEKNFQLKHWGFNNTIHWNSLPDASEAAIHLPTFVSNHSLYYEGNWFKGATHVQLGFDVTYFSSYYGDAYMPALGLYYLQHEKKIGNYPYIDFFFNIKVKHARIFFKTEHVNSGLMGAYYLAPHIPAPDRAIKVGINWVFYD